MMDRSYLFVPGNRPDRFDKAFSAGAHAVIIDLEDAVDPADKAVAREMTRSWLTAEKPVWLRINGSESEWFAEDLNLVTNPGTKGVVLPKVENTTAIAEIRSRMGASTRIIPLIESALGLWRAEAIASAEGVERLAFGSVDFQLDSGILGEREELLFARSQLVLISRVAGRLAPIDGVTIDLDDQALLREDVEYARRLGFGGKLCIHPKQVEGVNSGFSTPDTDLAWAHRVLEAAQATSNGAARLEGRLIDRPVIDQARAILASAKESR